MTRPLIGVSTSELRLADQHRDTPHGEPARRELALGVTYFEAIARAGGIPVMLPPIDVEAIDALLARLDGLCFSGGPDLTPALYGAEPDPSLGPTEPALDRFEVALMRRADALDLPILAICRGMQLLNVVRGGTLHQHLPGHRQTEPGSIPSHPVALVAGSRLATVAAGASLLAVNSFHHQAIDRLGERLVVTARGDDGLPEAVEDPDRRHLIGVQWHAECLVDDPVQTRLFAGLIEAASCEHRVVSAVA